MAFIVEEDEAPNPIHISGFGPDAVMFDAQMPADAIEELWGRSGRRGGGDGRQITHEGGQLRETRDDGRPRE